MDFIVILSCVFEKIDSLTDTLKQELIKVCDKSVRSAHHFLSDASILQN